MQKMRKMARAFFKVERNTLEVRFLLDSSKPILNHGVEFAFKNVCHALNGSTIPVSLDPSQTLQISPFRPP